MKDIKYILKRIIIGVGIALILMAIKSNVFAYTYVYNNYLNDSNYIVAQQGNIKIEFDNDTNYAQNWINVRYYALLLCTDAKQITSWYLNSSNNYADTLNITNTNWQCYFPNSSYGGGHVVIFQGQINSQGTGQNVIAQVSSTIYNPNQSSWALLSKQFSSNRYEVDYASNSIITGINNQTQAITNLQTGQTTIINQNNQINNNLNEVNDNLTNDTPPNDNELTSALDAGSLPGGGPISNIITFPLTMFNRFLSVLGTSCADLTIPIPYVSQTATIQCVNVYFTQLGFGAFYEIIGGLIGGVVLFYYLMYLYDRVNHLLFLEEKGDLKKYYS